MMIEMKRGTWEKINWNNFIAKNIQTIADGYTEHPALSN